jgi:hypothetical protein
MTVVLFCHPEHIMRPDLRHDMEETARGVGVYKERRKPEDSGQALPSPPLRLTRKDKYAKTKDQPFA